MKKRLTLVVVLCMTVAFTMCFSGSVFADTTPVVRDGVAGAANVGNNNAVTLFKVTANATGYLYITDARTKGLNSGSYMFGHVSLLDANQSYLSSESEGFFSNTDTSTSWMKYIVFGVKKGSTYYIRVNDTNSTGSNYNMYYNIQPVSNKSGSKKSKAKKLKKNKYTAGTITAGSSRSDWYKYKKKAHKVTITFNTAETNYKLKVTVYQKGRPVSASMYRSTNYHKFVYTSNKKGTIYIKISRGDSLSSGYYKMKVK